MVHRGTNEITTERLLLRRFVDADAPSILQNWAGDFKVQNDYGEPAYETLEAVQSLLARYIAAYESPETYRWGIFLRGNAAQCIGHVAYFIVDSKNELCEIEYCAGRDYQNKGFVTEAVKAVVAYGFQAVGFNRIQVSCRHVNHASRRVIEKCGFQYEGALRQFFNHMGEYQDRLYFSLLRREYSWS